jgi:hypothetical protein
MTPATTPSERVCPLCAVVLTDALTARTATDVTVFVCRACFERCWTSAVDVVPTALRHAHESWVREGKPAQPAIDIDYHKWQNVFAGGLELSIPGFFGMSRSLLDRFAVRDDWRVDDAVYAFIASQAWGYGLIGYGPYRTKRVLTSTPDAATNLLAIAQSVREDGLLTAFMAASTRPLKLHGLGTSFLTKYLYFIAEIPGRYPALVLDRIVGEWLDEHTVLRGLTGSTNADDYGRYLLALYAWAEILGERPADIEWLIFRGTP